MKYEVELSTGKKIIIRKPTIRDRRLALQGASAQSKDPIVVQALVLDEMMKVLVSEVDGQKIEGAKRESLDSWLDLSEYTQLQLGLEEMIGGAPSAPKLKMLPTAST